MRLAGEQAEIVRFKRGDVDVHAPDLAAFFAAGIDGFDGIKHIAQRGISLLLARHQQQALVAAGGQAAHLFGDLRLRKARALHASVVAAKSAVQAFVLTMV